MRKLQGIFRVAAMVTIVGVMATVGYSTDWLGQCTDIEGDLKDWDVTNPEATPSQDCHDPVPCATTGTGTCHSVSGVCASMPTTVTLTLKARDVSYGECEYEANKTCHECIGNNNKLICFVQYRYENPGCGNRCPTPEAAEYIGPDKCRP